MGGDQLVERVAGEAVERNVGDEVRRRHQVHLTERVGLVSATDGASELIELLRTGASASCWRPRSEQEITDRFLDLVDGPPRCSPPRSPATTSPAPSRTPT